MRLRLFAPTPWPAVLLLALSSLGCESKTKPGDATYTVSGVVRSSLDQSPLEGAVVQASGTGSHGEFIARSTQTDATGHYEIPGLRDSVTVTSMKAGFLSSSTSLQLTENTVVDLVMMKGGITGDLVANKTVTGSIAMADEKCDPQWDSRAPCRRFSFVPEAPRVYQIEVAFDCPELELHVFAGGTRLFTTSSKFSPLTGAVAMGGGVYEVRLMAYYECHRFDLIVK